MKLLCKLIDHKWHRTGAQLSRPIVCERCQVEPYDDVTLPEWLRNQWAFGFGRTLRNFAKRSRLYLKSRKCWKPGHEWSPVSEVCQRCGMTGVEDAERGEWMLPEWKRLWRAWLSDRIHMVAPAPNHSRVAVDVFSWRFGLERSTLFIRGSKYMIRYIAYLGPIGLRLHKFFSGDEDSAPHTHPWAFLTFPFHSYVELQYEEGVFKQRNVVKKFRFHFRPPHYEHIVKGPMWAFGLKDVYYHGYPLYSCEDNFEPFWTFVITGPRVNDWGFYPKPKQFIYWRDYKPGVRTNAGATA